MSKVLAITCWMMLLVPSMLWAAPDIELKDLAGKASNVNQYIGHGKWTVVVAWAHDCHVCNQEIHHMVFLHDEHKKKDATVLGISVDGYAKRRQAAAFIERHGLDFPNLITEPEQAIMRRFGAGSFVGTPTYYVYDPKGKLVAKNVGAVTQEDIEAFIAPNPVATDTNK